MGMRRAGAVMAFATVLLATACGGEDSSATGTASADGPTKVSVTTFGCEIWNTWAEAKGVYAKHGLQVEYVKSFGGSAAVAAVLSGAADFGYVNGFTAINAYNTGFPIQMVSGANVNALPPAEPAQGVFVKKGSAYKSAKDLVGKKIAVNEIGGINQIATSIWLEANGVSTDQVSFVALPYAEQVNAVNGDRVAAAQLGYALLGSGGADLRSLDDPFAALGKVYIATYVASKTFVAQGDTAKRFNDAMVETMKQLEDPANKDESFKLLSECSKVPAETLAAQPQNGLAPKVDFAALNDMAKKLVDLKMISKQPDLEPFVPAFARS